MTSHYLQDQSLSMMQRCRALSSIPDKYLKVFLANYVFR